ncbi:MAG: type II toxin-antitoxin system RatA family toxin [Hyphomicrobiaceae bacterium]
MPSFATQRAVQHSSAQMFDLVADVEKYPEFLPLCEGLTVTSRTTDAGGHPVVVARMTCGYKAIRESFTSRVTLDSANATIHVAYIDGPFRYLENTWRFKDRVGSPGCTVDFHIDYEFRSRMLGLVVGSLFDKAFRKFATAFEARAQRIYGPVLNLSEAGQGALT